MAKKRGIQRTGFSTSEYRGGRKALTDKATGSAGRGNRYVSRRQQYYARKRFNKFISFR